MPIARRSAPHANHSTRRLVLALVAAGLPAAAFAQVAVPPSVTVPTGAGPSAVVDTDFNADGRPDLATTNLNAGSVSVLLGNASGGFSSAPAIQVGLPSQVRLKGIAAGRILASNSDLALADENGFLALFSNANASFTGIGDDSDPGSLHNPQSWGIADKSTAAAVADFSGTGQFWAVVGLQKLDEQVATRLRAADGDGGLRGGDWPAPTGAGPNAMTIGSFNATVANPQFAAAWPGIVQPDARKDIAVCNATDGTVDILLHARDQPTGTIINGTPAAGPQGIAFYRSQRITVGPKPVAVVVGRFNGDALDDLAVACAGNSRVYILFGTGDGKFIVNNSFPVAAGAASLAAGDIDADGRTDLVLVCNDAAGASLKGQGVPPSTAQPLAGTLTAMAGAGARGVGFDASSAYVWQAGGAKVTVPSPAAGLANRAYCLSSDGNWVVGSTPDPARANSPFAYRWSSTTSPAPAAQWLSQAAGSTASEARSVSADGATIAGWYTTASRDFACRWLPASNTVAAIETLLGAAVTGGTQLRRCYNVSDDGRVFFGEGVRTNSVAVTWVARFPAVGSPTYREFTEPAAGARLSLDGSRLCLVPFFGQIRIYDTSTGTFFTFDDVGNQFGGRHFIGMSDDGTHVYGTVRDSFNSLAPGSQIWRVAGFSRVIATGVTTQYDQTSGLGFPPSFTPTPFMMRSGVILTDGTRYVPAGAINSAQLTAATPNSSLAFNISRNGATVCGATIPDGSFHAAVWPIDTTFDAFGQGGSLALSTSNTGVSVGQNYTQRGFRYSGGTLTELPLPPGTVSAFALGISPDGVTTVGYASTSGNLFRAYRHTLAGGSVELNRGAAAQASAWSTSDDGHVIIGWITGGGGTTACRWVDGAGPFRLFPDPEPYSGEAFGASADGSVITGVRGSSAFRWTPTGSINLPSPAGVTFSIMSARAISADGKVIVGHGPVNGNQTAWIWVEGAGSFLLSDYLQRLGVDTTGWNLQYLRGISADGRIAVGYGINPTGQQEAFVARIGRPTGSATVLRCVNAAGAFEAVSRLTVGNVPSAAKVANIVGDARLDVVITAQGSNRVEVFNFRLPCRIADVASLGGATGGDAQLTADDVIAFLNSFFVGNLAVADLASLGGAPGADGQLTADDLILFLSSFFGGC